MCCTRFLLEDFNTSYVTMSLTCGTWQHPWPLLERLCTELCGLSRLLFDVVTQLIPAPRLCVSLRMVPRRPPLQCEWSDTCLYTQHNTHFLHLRRPNFLYGGPNKMNNKGRVIKLLFIIIINYMHVLIMVWNTPDCMYSVITKINFVGT